MLPVFIVYSNEWKKRREMYKIKNSNTHSDRFFFFIEKYLCEGYWDYLLKWKLLSNLSEDLKKQMVQFSIIVLISVLYNL